MKIDTQGSRAQVARSPIRNDIIPQSTYIPEKDPANVISRETQLWISLLNNWEKKRPRLISSLVCWVERIFTSNLTRKIACPNNLLFVALVELIAYAKIRHLVRESYSSPRKFDELHIFPDMSSISGEKIFSGNFSTSWKWKRKQKNNFRFAKRRVLSASQNTFFFLIYCRVLTKYNQCQYFFFFFFPLRKKFWMRKNGRKLPLLLTLTCPSSMTLKCATLGSSDIFLWIFR